MKNTLIILAIALCASCAPNKAVTASGLQYQILEKGSGTPAKAGDEVLIFETTSYRNGTVLYSNYNAASPVKVLIGGN